MVGVAAGRPAPPLPDRQGAASLARARADHAAAIERATAAARDAAAAHRRAETLGRQGVREDARLRAAEAREADTAARIEALATRRAADGKRIASLSATLAATLPALALLRAAPLGTVLALPGSPVGNVARAAAVSGIAATVARKLAELRGRREDAAQLDAALGRERARLAAEHDVEVERAGRIEDAERAARASERVAASSGAAAARDAAASAAHASSLADAIAALARAEHAATAAAAGRHGARSAVARRSGAAVAVADAAGADAGAGLGDGALAPVTGPVVQRYGASTDAGPASGVSYAPPPAAPVRSPCTGTVVFAAPFRSYGRMVIVDCGQSWRFVLAGLAAVDAGPGARVRAGEPVGRMPDWTPGAAATGRPTLYVQLRHGSGAVDPGRYVR